MKRILILILTVAIFSVSCKKYLDTAYKNPNLPTYAQAELVLQSCISAMHRGIAFDARGINFYTQNFANIVTANYNPERHGYAPGSDTYGEFWRVHYWNMGFNIIDMIDSGKVAGKFDYVAAAFTLNAFSWVTVADIHGELPVLQAFEKGRLSFDYDDQPVAYSLALSYCDSALTYWEKARAMSAPTLAQGDLYFFQGDQSKWKKFVYGIKARIFHRYFKKSSYLSKEVDSVIKYSALAMQSTTDDAMVQFNMAYPDNTARNFFGPSRNNVGGYRIGAFPVNIMTGDVTSPGLVFGNTVNDPRVKYLMRPSPDGVYRGITPAQYQDNPSTPVDRRVPSFWGRIAETTAPALGVDTGARTYFRNDSKWPLMTYSEMQFLRAEAYFVKGDKVSARTAYINGITGHFDMLNTHYYGYLNATGTNSPAPMTKVTIPQIEIDAYLSNPAFVPLASNLTLKHIMCQKYLSLWGWGAVENWVDMRRYNYDEVNIYPSYTRLSITLLYPDNGGKLAERLRPRYNSEYLWNIEALKKVGAYEPDYHTKKVWFSIP